MYVLKKTDRFIKTNRVHYPYAHVFTLFTLPRFYGPRGIYNLGHVVISSR